MDRSCRHFHRERTSVKACDPIVSRAPNHGSIERHVPRELMVDALRQPNRAIDKDRTALADIA